MDTNINNPKHETDRIFGINRNLFIVIVILICVLSLCVGIYAQFFYKYSESDPFMFGFTTSAKEEEEITKLISDFDNIFTNELISNNNVNIQKIDNNQDIVYKLSETSENSEGLYNINAIIPCININTDTAKEMNTDIENNFLSEIAKIKGSTDIYKVYTVNYIAYLNGDLLSVAIRSTYYEQEGTQITKIKTYNYNLNSNSKVNLADIMKAKGLKPENVQKEINNKIKELDANDSKIGYSATRRDLNSDIYKIENTDTFLVSNDGDIYIRYNYETQKDVLVY